MASDFIYTNPEAARQAIAKLQLQAALAENTSRENIAREQTSAARYATQSQISEREKDRAVSREDIASRERSRTGAGADAATRERANVQYQTLLAEINELDPPTKQELETRMAAFPQLADDLKNNLRSTRDQAYKSAKANAAMGERLAKNYQAELGGKGIAGKGLDDTEKQKIYERIAKDANVLFDRVTGSVESSFRPPREDAQGATGTPPPSSQMMGAAGLGVPTIADVRARITGGVTGAPIAISPAQDYGGAVLPPTMATLTTPPPAPAAPTPSVNAFGVPTFSGIARSLPIGVSPHGGLEFRNPFPRVSDIAPPPVAVPPPSFAAPRVAPPVHPYAFDLPQYQSPAGNLEALLGIAQDPGFSTLPPDRQRWILDEIGNASQRMPRVSDMQGLRPQYIPPMEDRYIPLQ